jgi:hypothetical protein
MRGTYVNEAVKGLCQSMALMQLLVKEQRPGNAWISSKLTFLGIVDRKFAEAETAPSIPNGPKCFVGNSAFP